jgi:carboxyl-terminal processing protease
MPKISKILVLAVSLALVLTIFLGARLNGVAAATDGQDGAYRQINVYAEVLQKIQTAYVVEPNIPDVTNGALRGLLESLDADSSYLTPEDNKLLKAKAANSPKVGQVGINVSKRFGYATVISVVPGSPADRSGLVDGDFLESIDGQDTHNLSLAMIQRMLEGTPGSTLTVGVVRPGKNEPDRIAMGRAIVNLPPVSDSLYENSSILYLKPAVIDRDHVQQIEAKLKTMQKSGTKKVLLDLRDVASGDMAEGTRLANLLMKNGTIATLEGQKFPKQVFTADPAKAIQPTAPMVVLVNRGTAGPAELVAAALMDNKRADLVGEKTFGEGGEQKTFDLPNGAALILTIAKYQSPSGKKLQDEGVMPNVVVASAGDQADGGDQDVGPAQPNATPFKKPTMQTDDQLTRALEILKNKNA